VNKMKILIGFLLALFISSQAYAQSATEVVRDGKLFKEKDGYDIYLYKKELYSCAILQDGLFCYKLKDMGIITKDE
jgi:hypothetical protein